MQRKSENFLQDGFPIYFPLANPSINKIQRHSFIELKVRFRETHRIVCSESGRLGVVGFIHRGLDVQFVLGLLTCIQALFGSWFCRYFTSETESDRKNQKRNFFIHLSSYHFVLPFPLSFYKFLHRSLTQPAGMLLSSNCWETKIQQ